MESSHYGPTVGMNVMGRSPAVPNGSTPSSTSLSASLSSFLNVTRCEEERLPRWKSDLLMEKLRQKSMFLKPLTDTSKNIRQALMERRCILDLNDKANLQKSLDTLQQSIKVNSLQSMVERLEMVARQQGLKCTPGATGHEWFISSDMFYLEVLIDPSGVVEDVKIQHDGKTEQQSCPEIVDCLKKTDFVDFTAHLEGLVSIYQLNADKKIKSKAYVALQALEADLASMAATYSHLTDAETMIMKSLIGLLQPRKGGHPAKLVYFITPYEFLDVATKTSFPNDVKTVFNRKLGSSATISVQGSTSHKLQMSTTVHVSKTPDGKSIPHYGTLNATNSTVLPACFVVNLGKPVPMCLDLVKAIQSTTKIESFDLSNPQPILNLVTEQASNKTLQCSMDKGLFVSLPDQNHCYYMTETPNLGGIMVSSISFTLACQLPQVFTILRQQMAFNTLVSSCVRTESKPELDHIVFEVNALSHQKLAVSFQHPLDDSLVTLEFDMRDVMHPHCHLHAVANATDIIPTLEEHACRVVKRSMSIPITLRAVIRRWQTMKVKMDPPNPDFSVAVNNGNMNVDVGKLSERSCSAESSERRSNSNHQNIVVPPGIVNFGNNNASKTVPSTNSYNVSTMGFPNQNSQNPIDILSYMNPFLNLQNQISNMTGGSSFPNITQNMAIQMLASQMGQPGNPSSMLMGLLDQVGQTQKRRKRKNTVDNLPSPKQNLPLPLRPNQSPQRTQQKSPIRRQSDSSDGSGADKNSMNMLMNDLGMDNLPDSRWNIDITPVSTNSDSLDDLDSIKKHGKKTTPKRSLSLDSHSSEDVSNIQNLIDGTDFKPLITPSLSITPVSSTSNVNSILASIRPGIEIIPLPNPVNIPTSLPVTSIMSTKPGISDKDKQKKTKERNLTGKRKLEGESDRPAKIPFMENKGRVSPNINLSKKPSSPNLLNSPTKPLPASGGKPSVSTLKSVSSSTVASPKYIDSTKQIKKKPGPKTLKNIMNVGGIPALKAISSDLTPMTKSEIPIKSEVPKADVKSVNHAQAASMAVSQALQQAAATLVANAGAQKPPVAKKGGLISAVIDKLKSVHTSSSESISMAGDKKETVSTTMSTKDYLKVSSAITNDVLQQKKALNAGTPGQEYMVKGGQGLKLTINKAKLKDPSKSPKPLTPGLKSPVGIKKVVPGMKPLSALSAKLASVTKKSVTPTKEFKDMLSKSQGLAGKFKDGKPRLESEDLTKKLFLPGAVKSLESGMFSTAPVFDPNKFQIPKKSRVSSTVGNLVSEQGNKSLSSSIEGSPSSMSSRQTPSRETDSGKDKSQPNSRNATPTPMDVEVGALSEASAATTHFEKPETTVSSSEVSSSMLQQPITTSVETPPAEPDSTSKAETGALDMSQSDAATNEESIISATVGTSISEFASPESPDPFNCVVNASTPQNIPTTPLNPTMEESPKITTSTNDTPPPAIPPVSVSAPLPLNQTTSSEEMDEDQLFIDDGTEETGAKEESSEDNSAKNLTSEEKSKSPEMPPPPPPPAEVSGTATATTAVSSPATTTMAPPASPKPVTSPLTSGSATVGIASVHIVHSPQPNSPAMLRSPLVQASPAASPYAIDDDLMDEALIGGSSK